MPINTSRISDSSITIWRYLDFWKFESMLEEGGNLYFTRADEFKDTLEGTYSDISLSQAIDTYRKKHGATFVKNWKGIYLGKSSTDGYINAVKKNSLVSCWHINEIESSQMWKNYINDEAGEGVVIKSSAKKLITSLDIDNNKSYFSIDVGEVRYIDFHKEPIEIIDNLTPLFIKDSCFEYEAELRTIVWKRPESISSENSVFTQEENGEKVPVEKGASLKIDLRMLIDEIRISPTTPTEKIKTIQEKLSHLQIEVPIKPSYFSK